MDLKGASELLKEVLGKIRIKNRYIDNVVSFFRWFRRNRRIQVIFLILVFALPVFLLIYGIVIPLKHSQPSPSSSVNNLIPIDTASNRTPGLNDDQLEAVKRITQKENEKAFQQSRLSLVRKDSIYMILNIPDSMLQLEIKGVTVKRARLIHIDISNRFSLISHENLLPWISEPFTLERDLATIPKSPIVVKQAPKDTIEAAQMSTKPPLPDSTNVFFTFYFDRNLVLDVEQDDPLSKGYTDKVRTYRNMKRKESRRSVFNLLRNPRQTDQPLLIKLSISEVEARAIYRAAPINTRLVLKL